MHSYNYDNHFEEITLKLIEVRNISMFESILKLSKNLKLIKVRIIYCCDNDQLFFFYHELDYFLFIHQINSTIIKISNVTTTS